MIYREISIGIGGSYVTIRITKKMSMSEIFSAVNKAIAQAIISGFDDADKPEAVKSHGPYKGDDYVTQSLNHSVRCIRRNYKEHYKILAQRARESLEYLHRSKL